MYQEKNFGLTALPGLSEKQIAEHIKLYNGYVKNLNELNMRLEKMQQDPAADAYVVAELRRRIGFEFNGARLHDYYFGDLGGNGVLADGGLKSALATQYGSYENWLKDFKACAMSRGTGWAILAYDADAKRLFNIWVTNHEQGHLAGAKILVALDVWEHAFLFDYIPAQRKDYVDAYLANLDWKKIATRF
jgi:Fe-Mn family superoxide dismutase